MSLKNKQLYTRKATQIRLLSIEVRQRLRALIFLRKPLKPRNDHSSITRNINKTGSHNPDPETKPKRSRSLIVIEPSAIHAQILVTT